MLRNRFVFLGKVFLLAFLLVNAANFLPVKIFDLGYYIKIITVISDTGTLLVLGISIPRYLYINELKKLENYKENNVIDTIDESKINLLRIKNFNIKKTSYYIFILFLVLTLVCPILLLLEVNKNDIYTSNVIVSIENDFAKKKSNIEKLISLGEKNLVDKKELKKLKDSILDLSSQQDFNISSFTKINNQNIFNSIIFIVRNLFLCLLWAITFYKIYKI